MRSQGGLDAPVMKDAGDRLFLGWGANGLSLRLYRPRDEQKFTARADFAEEFGSEGGVVPDGPKWTLTRGGQPIAVGGFEREPGPGRYYGAWAYASELSPREWAFAVLCARAAMGWLKHRHSAAQIGVLLNGPTPEKQRTARRMGFNFLSEAA